jgi:bacterioferritin
MNMMNKAIAREMQVAVQYMWQHVQWTDVKGSAVRKTLKAIGITEMKHAETIADRLVYFGGIPTTKSDPVFVGKNPKEMVMTDKKDEEGAIKLYKEIIKLADKEGDTVSRKMFKRILTDEEKHLDTFRTILEKI